jgi:O-antigen/teichoic acid export membrane protein
MKPNGGAVYSVMPNAVSALFSLLVIRGLTESLSANELGETMLLIGLFSLVDAVVCAPLNQVIFLDVCRKRSQKKFSEITYFLLPPAVLGLLIGVSMLTLAIFEVCTLGRWAAYAAIAVLFVLYIFSEVIRQTINAVMNASGDRKGLSIQALSDSILYFMFVVSSQMLIPGLVSLAAAIVSAKAITSYLCKKRIKAHEILKKSKYFGLMGGLGWTTSSADRYAVAAFSGVASAGIYSVGSGLVSRPYALLSSSLTTHFRPQLVSSISRNDTVSEKTTSLHWVASAVLLCLIGVFAITMADDLIANLLLGKNYQNSVSELMPVFALSMTFTVLTHFFDNGIIAYGDSKNLFLTQLVCLPICLGLIAFGAWLGGAYFAAVGKLFADAIRLLAAMTLAGHLRKLRNP